MSKFNFDSEFYRRVISRCEEARKIPSLTQMVREAVDIFYDEYDYYPKLAAYAPGTFMIMGDHLEYVKGNLVQCAMPLMTVIVGKSFCSLKCKLYTTSKNVEGLKKSVFPVSQYKKNLKVFPEWVNYIKGVINYFPYKEVAGFDAVIHSNVPFCQAYGSSAALQVGFYTFLEACVGRKKQDKKKRRGNLCLTAERLSHTCDRRIGEWNNFTTSMSEKNSGVLINCRNRDVLVFDMRETDILFLLIYPNFEIERKDRDLIVRRELELKLAAKLLGLAEIIDATDRDLEALENMEDPTRETVIAILRSFGADEDIIQELVKELFYFPEVESIPGEEYNGEGRYYEIPRTEPKLGDGEDEEEEEHGELPGEQDVRITLSITEDCLFDHQLIGIPAPMYSPHRWQGHAQNHNTSTTPNLQKRIAELCEGKKSGEMDLPQRVCEEINCLGGLENLSVDSNLTVCGKLLKRVRHVLTENLRSLELPEIISRLDYEEFGTKLIQSHLSLKLDFDVSCATLDGLVQLAIDAESVYGAKMMSGGGVLVLVILHRRVLECFIEEVIMKYGDRFQFYSVFPSSGARITSVGMRLNPKSTLSKPFLNQDQLLKSAIEQFESTYKYKPTHGAFAPGAVHLLGDHTDYNHGLCLTMGVNMLTVVVGACNGTTKVRAATTMFFKDDPPKVIFILPEGESEMKPGTVKWARFIKGVVAQFKGPLKGFDCLITSAVPCGTGLGSKSALVTSFYTFLEEISGFYTENLTEKAHRCMLAQHEFVSLLSGIGEVTTSIKSREDFVNFLDCRSTRANAIPFQNPSVTFLVTVTDLQTTERRALLYVRMEECFDVARALGGKTLRCLTLKHIEALRNSDKKISEKKLRRAEHIIVENERVLKATEALKNGDYEALGELMVASHNSIRDNYDWMIPEVDTLVKLAMEVDGVLGSKIMSAGVTPCTISMVKLWAVDDLIEYLQKSYDGHLEFYMVNSFDGCSRLDVQGYVETLPSPQFVFEDIFPF